MENTITTYNGEVARKKDCRFIKGEFYIKNKQCFEINGTWYRINSGYIALDHEIMQYVLIKENNLIKGIIGYDESTDKIVLGYFSSNPYRNVIVLLPDGTKYKVLDKDILKNGFWFNLRTLEFYHNNISKTSNWNKINDSYCLSNHPYGELQYNLRNCKKEDIDKIKNLSMKAIDFHKASEFLGKNVRELPNYTYGLEFETNSGVIPQWELMNGGFVPLRDGSIRGIEYVTIPYGAKDIGRAVSLACHTLDKYTKMSINESLHLHIGNLPNVNEVFIGKLYTLCCILEKEIFSMFPLYYDQTSKFKARQKDYNKPLARALVDLNPKTTFENIGTYLSAGKKYTGFGSVHPSDPDGTHKWQIETRYHWVNFINLLFGNNKTIEFRVHTPTKNPYKIMNWIFITSAIVEYADYLRSNSIDMSSVKNVTLETIMRKIYNREIADRLCKYIEYRKRMRKEDDLVGDYIGEREVRDDMNYFEL